MKSLTKIIIAALAILGVSLFASTAFGGTTASDQSSAQPLEGGRVVNYTFFSATTTNATSTNILPTYDSEGRYEDGTLNIAGAKQVTFLFGRGGATSANTGVTRFEVEVSQDKVTWLDWNRLIGNDVAATATTSDSITAATTTKMYGMDLDRQAPLYVRCIAIETTDGEHTCKATAVW